MSHAIHCRHDHFEATIDLTEVRGELHRCDVICCHKICWVRDSAVGDAMKGENVIFSFYDIYIYFFVSIIYLGWGDLKNDLYFFQCMECIDLDP